MNKKNRVFIIVLVVLSILAVPAAAVASFPVIEAENGGFNNTDSNSHIVNLPTGIASGDLLLVFFSAKGDPTITFPTGWTSLFNTANLGIVRFGCWYRIAEGSEDTTITVTTPGNSVKTAHTSYRISGYSGLPEANASVGSDHTGGRPPLLSPSWGARDTLWIAACGHDGGNRAVNTYPTNYSNGRNDRSWVSGVGVGTARRSLNDASENPGAFTMVPDEVPFAWVAATVAISPQVPPVVTTQAATNVELTTATLNGTVTAVNASHIIQRGFVYDTVSHGDPGDVHPVHSGYSNNTTETGSFGTGAFSLDIEGLTSGTTYYYRAYAMNYAGYRAYGPQLLFDTEQLPPPAPKGVSATAGDHTDKVLITWTKSPGATGYQVYRDGIALGWLGDVATFSDFDASAPTITPGTASASKGTSTEHVVLTLSGAAANPGSEHTYTVKARNDSGESALSSADTGYRGTSTLSYQWQRSAADFNSDYSNIKGATSVTYNDSSAPVPTVTPGTASASKGTSPDHVTLTVTGTSANVGAGRYYRCVVSMSDAVTQYSNENRGYIGVGSLTYQWYRSSRDDDSNYSLIRGATTNPYNDTGAPAGGSGRYYVCLISAAGAESQPTNSDRGYREATVGVSVATDAATGIGDTSATLNMNFTLGSYSSVDVRFAYKKPSDDKWVNTAWTRQTQDGTYSEALAGLTSDTDYDFKAQLQYNATVIEGDILQFTTEASSLVPPGTPVLSSPGHGEVIAGESASLEWAPSEGADFYSVYIVDITDPADHQVIVEPPDSIISGTTYTVEGLSDEGRIYAWTVAASDSSTGLWSAYAGFRVFVNGTDREVLPPTLTSPEAEAYIEGTSVTLEWEGPAGADFFTIWLFNLDTGETVAGYDGSEVYVGTSHTVEGLTDNGETYAWSVAASDGATWSDYAFPRLFVNE